MECGAQFRFGNPGRRDEFHGTSNFLRALNTCDAALEDALFGSRNGSALLGTSDVSLRKSDVAIDHAGLGFGLRFRFGGVDSAGITS